MKTEAEIRAQLVELAAGRAQREMEILAIDNQIGALQWALGEVEEPQVETTVMEGGD